MLVYIDYELNFAAPFHFGTGIRAGLVDRTVIRDRGSYLYVPASTFKGSLREHCEHLSRFYAPGGQEHLASPHNAYAALAEFGKPPTLVSQIFGSPLNPGTLLFADARQAADASKEYQADIYKDAQVNVSTQVRIDRATGTAANEALYTSEFGIRDLAFEGSIKGQLYSPELPSLARSITGYDEEIPTYTLTPGYALLLLLAGILLIEQLGGNKSTGKGQCSCSITGLKLDGLLCPEKDWRAWIEQLDVLSDYQPEEKGTRA